MKKITSFLLVFLFSIFFVGCTEKEDDIEKTLKEMTSLEVTELMGNGINLGNTMEAYGRATVGITGDVSQYETAWGQPVTTKEMIKGMKEAGFDTLRIPVAWTNTIDYKNGNYDINPAYLKRVAEITDYALEEDMFVIINEHWSGGWWGMFGSSDQNLRKVANDLYISMWTQIGNHFKDYSYRLIFESANEELGLRLNDEIDGVPGVLTDDETYSETNRINQLFVDTIRNLGSKNSDRFLLIAGYNTDINRTLDERFQMPTDTAEAKLLLSVHYYDPSDYTLQSVSTWGTEDDFVYQNEKFASLEKFIEAGYGIIIGEYGVLPTPDDKIKSNIIDYTKNLLDNCDLYGYVPVLWDTSTFFIRKDLEMYDEEFAELFASRSYAVQKDISKEEVKNAAQASLDEALAAAQQRDIDSGYADFKNKAIAWIMFASSDWGINYSVGDEYKPRSRTDGVTGTDVTIEAVGEFTVALDFTGSGAGSANSVGFMALAIYNGEKFYPDHIIEIKELKFNDEIYDIKNKIYYTTSDDQNTTRVNIYNVWVTKVPEDARVLNPRLQNYATPVIIDPEKLSEIRTVEITFVLKPAKRSNYETFPQPKKFEIVGFNHFWKFSKKHLDCSYEEALNSLESFQDVVLPHDWLIYQVDDLYESSSGWYYKKFLLNKEATCRYFIRFDGVYMDSTVYLNYQKVGEWKNGYTSFEFEITDFCRDGENIMVVRVLHEHPNSRWYSGAGIYRNVYILKKQENHLLSNGIYLHTNPKTGEVIIETEMNLSKNVVLEHNILREDYLIASTRVSVSKNFNKVKMKVEDKVNWSPANPVLYKLITNLYLDNEIIDGLRTYFGFKDVLMDPNLGFILNGEKQKLNGVCEHHDLGAFGAAFSKITLKKRLKMLKEMGVNAIRCAHSVPAPELMELADEMGFLIVSEAFDMWELSKNPYDYARFFNEWVEKDVESWIKRDRNHVSLLMWSIGNEIYDTHASKRGLELTKMLRDLILKHDPYENGKITICSNFLMGENTQQAADELKLVGYNYLEHLYEKHHKKYPDWVIFGSETASIVQSRGIYHFPLAEQIYYHEDKQCSSLGNSITSWGAKSLESSLTIDRDLKFSLGQFIWTGHDYLGEPTPYDTKNSYFGQIDTAGFPKDAYFVRQASWRKDLPVLHIFPYWNFNEGELIDVRVATNLEKIELFLNDKLVGSKCINVETDQKIIPTWQVPFEKGELKAIAYNKAGEEVARVSKKTFSNPVDFKITVLDQVLKADGVDVSEVVIETIDSEGNLVEDDNQILEVIVTGAGKLLGLDNGDSTDYSPFKGRIKPLFSGKLKAFIGSLYHPGTIHVTIKSQFIKAKEFTLVAVEVPLNFEQELAKKKNHYLRSSIIDNDLTDNELMNQIPVRKIKLRTFTKVLNQDHKQAFIQAKTLPNCAVADMKWSIVTKKGIPTDNAIIKKAENGIILEGVKDGEFVLRGAVCNQKQQAAVISELGFAVSGISPAYKNPFIFISAGLYDDFSGEIKPGNEFGIATSDQELTTVIYQNLNFDKHNSKKITLSIFSFTSEPLEIEVYYQDSEAKAYHYLDKLTYQKETIWNLYQEESYLLPKELTGIVALKLVFGRAVHFKGFYFERKSHRGQLISILDADTYYGDYYTRQDWGFSEIGNNTTFIFNELYFDQEVDEITIEGKANVQDNSIRIQVTDRTGNCETYQVEFLQKSEFSKQCFKIKPLKGNYRVEFIFLPGSNFNFKTFEFS